MKVSTEWLRQLVNMKVPVEEVVRLLNLQTLATKEVTADFIELDMKGYNRADLLSMRGVAYEIAALTNSKLNFDIFMPAPFRWEAKSPVSVHVEDKKLCPLYCVAKIEGLKVKQSPDHWIKKLQDCGIRSVSNIADVTNLVMLEYGQPLHAFDASLVKNEALIIRTAKKGETLTTLDGKVRKLTENDLLIADCDKPLGLAGIIGGKDSEVSQNCTAILLEAAIFDPVAIRRTSQRLGIYSEASRRFQHGLTKKNLLQSFLAAIKMYESLGGKLTALTLVGNFEDKTKTILLTQKKIDSLIGIKIDPEFTKTSLQKLGFNLASRNHPCEAKQVWSITVPYWRLDIDTEEDLIEEVARMYGYEKIPAKELEGELPKKINQSLFALIYGIKTFLAKLGLTEVQTYSYYGTAVINNLDLHKLKLIRIANPMSSETEYLRDHIWPNLLEVTVSNLKHHDDIAIFEVGKSYFLDEGRKPREKYQLAISISNGTDNPIVEVNTILQKLKERFNLVFTLDEASSKLFHPMRSLQIKVQGQTCGVMGEVHLRILNSFGTGKRVAIAELDLAPFLLY